MIRASLVVLALLLAFARPARAHPMDVGSLRIDVDDRTADVQLDIDINLAALLLHADEHAMDEAAIAARTDELATVTYRAAPIRNGDVACAWAGVTTALHGRSVRLSDKSTCSSAIRTLRWPMPFAAAAQPTFKLLVKTHTAAGDQASIVERDKPVIELTVGDAADAPSGFGDTVRAGAARIGVAPSEWRAADGRPRLPAGLAYLLFVLALVLAGGALRPTAVLVAAYTIAHSITLALSAFDLVHMPEALIAPLVAVSSIALAAVAFTGKPATQRWRIAAGFGVVHGFAFARALPAPGVGSLVGYNLGIELGQLVILVVAAPLVFRAYRDPRARVVVAKILPVLLALGGVYELVVALRAG